MPFNSSEIDEIRSIVQDQLRKGLRSLPRDSLFPNQIFGAERRGSVLTSCGTGAEWSDDTEWRTDVEWMNDWGVYNDNNFLFGYRRHQGAVEMRGLIKSPSGSFGYQDNPPPGKDSSFNIAFKLPSGVLTRSGYTKIFTVNSHYNTLASVELSGNGVLRVIEAAAPIAGPPSVPTWVSLEGVFWESENLQV